MLRCTVLFLNAFFWIVLTGILCTLEKSGTDGLLNIPFIDKIAHFFLHLHISFFTLTSFKPKGVTKIILFLTLLISYGITLEIIQENYIEGRLFEWFDIVANSLGSLAGFILFSKISDFNKVPLL